MNCRHSWVHLAFVAFVVVGGRGTSAGECIFWLLATASIALSIQDILTGQGGRSTGGASAATAGGADEEPAVAAEVAETATEDAAAEVLSGRLVIVQARYGASGGRDMDVTDMVKDMVNDETFGPAGQFRAGVDV